MYEEEKSEKKNKDTEKLVDFLANALIVQYDTETKLYYWECPICRELFITGDMEKIQKHLFEHLDEKI